MGTLLSGCTVDKQKFDIYAPAERYLEWLDTAGSLTEAIRKAATRARLTPGRYLIVNQSTGERHVIDMAKAADA